MMIFKPSSCIICGRLITGDDIEYVTDDISNNYPTFNRHGTYYHYHRECYMSCGVGNVGMVTGGKGFGCGIINGEPFVFDHGG
jgi:hypothetical protein